MISGPQKELVTRKNKSKNNPCWKYLYNEKLFIRGRRSIVLTECTLWTISTIALPPRSGNTQMMCMPSVRYRLDSFG